MAPPRPTVRLVLLADGARHDLPASTRVVRLGDPLDVEAPLTLHPPPRGAKEGARGGLWSVEGESASGMPVREQAAHWDVLHDKGRGFLPLGDVRRDYFFAVVGLTAGPAPARWPRPVEPGAFALAAAYVLREGEDEALAVRWLDLARRAQALDLAGPMEAEREAARRGGYDRPVRLYEPTARAWATLPGDTVAVRLPAQVPLGVPLHLARPFGLDALGGARGATVLWPADGSFSSRAQARGASLAALGGAWAAMASRGATPGADGAVEATAMRVLADGEDADAVAAALGRAAPGTTLGSLPGWRW